MKRFIETIRNIFRIEDLRVRLVNTLLLLIIYRIGSYVVLPGIDPNKLQQLQQQTSDGILGIINMFAGGAFSRGSVFALGIMPYISASIVVQLLTLAIPTFQKMQKEGEDGRRKINQWTRYLTIIITAVQSVGYLVNLKSESGEAILSVTNPELLADWVFMTSSVIILTASTMFIMWLGERITDKGLGNGISLIIMVGIIARLPQSILAEFDGRFSEAGGGLVVFLIEIVALLGVITLVILLIQGTRRIPVQYAKRIEGSRQFGGARQYIPLKVNAAGVMPIIFAQALMFIPASVAQFFPNQNMEGFVSAFVDYTSFVYNFTFALLIVLFTYFYTAITVNSTTIADDLKRNNGFIPGIKPGKNTAEFIDAIMSKITLPGSLFLALVAILPSIAALFNVNSQFAQFYGGTSLLIMVGVVLDTLQQIESHLMMRHYDGLMKSGRIRGRNAAVGVGAA
ncbi:MAG TPA: preprotein translocase subunit SecY [Bacteroidia bacterium]|jgi:preprotein translocase subunit SecY|nr:preprotein translocase subunit SecY [Bacteroidia bacterium]MBP7261336.1 preprotein translocase subunit SecY [Bacteroidia bacterium]MBP9180623.1 preprotein translocase subunit SecY [Bacteroidia bacterium]MBP9724961.1 preprotein translocase subunit SecY [Bacteroidia bacterium]HLP34118.1 preprotein translocase subunit SecY [Bacteroidia bacterium]